MSTLYKQRASYQSTQNSTYTRTDLPGQVLVLSKYSIDSLFCTGADTQTKTENSQWKVKIVKRQNASSAYKRTWQTCSVGLCTCTTKTVVDPFQTRYGKNAIRWLGGEITNYSNWVDDAVVLDKVTKTFRRRLTSQSGFEKGLQPLIENVKDMRQNIRGATKTTTDFMETLIKIKNGITKQQRGKFKKFVMAKNLTNHYTKMIGNAWLSWNFGISPMIKDIHDASLSIADYLARTDHTTSIHSSSHSVRLIGANTIINTGALGAALYSTHEGVSRVSYRLKGGFVFKISAGNDYTAADHFGFTPGMVIPTAWELLPFSWVADYFSTIGQFLEDTFICTPGVAVYLDLTRKAHVHGVISQTHKASVGTLITSRRDNVNTYDYHEFERTPQNSLPASSLRLLSRDEQGLFGLTKLLNLVAVASGGLHPGVTHFHRK